ncbi:MAG: hydrogenase nickel incorporation protein HypB [Synergistetes bacterium]|nr:hydrogenase nickel incorporation protein HypB [Synergistota bacterium]MCX8128151.1 hydrogenase nickel incorporation protein HypB [Synergistota bacterium]MDW8192527.1 hydrogenase nickel incorporation protein HypB [Synergistota bacterium]
MEIKIVRKVLEAEKRVAETNRKIFKEKGIVTFNLIGSPGAGKTSLLLRVINRLKDKYKIGVIEGDLTTIRDAELIHKAGVPVVQINTEGGCHLDANLVGKAIEELPLDDMEILFIENVGNLVCPTAFDLGEDYKIGVLSVPEGDDKPEKYPVVVKVSKAIVLNKIDILPLFKFNKERFYMPIRRIAPDMPVFEVSCETEEGIEEFVNWIVSKINRF